MALCPLRAGEASLVLHLGLSQMMSYSEGLESILRHLLCLFLTSYRTPLRHVFPRRPIQMVYAQPVRRLGFRESVPRRVGWTQR